MAKPAEINDEFHNIVIDMVKQHILKHGIPSKSEIDSIRINALELIKIYYPDQTKDCYITFPKNEEKHIEHRIIINPPTLITNVGTGWKKEKIVKKRPWWKFF